MEGKCCLLCVSLLGSKWVMVPVALHSQADRARQIQGIRPAAKRGDVSIHTERSFDNSLGVHTHFLCCDWRTHDI